jgi:hypothetical protein
MKRRIVRILVVLVVGGSVAMPIIIWWRTVSIMSPWLWISIGYGDVSVLWGDPGDFMWFAGAGPVQHSGHWTFLNFYFHAPRFGPHGWNVPWWLIDAVLWPAAVAVLWWTGRWRRSGEKRGFPVEAVTPHDGAMT